MTTCTASPSRAEGLSDMRQPERAGKILDRLTARMGIAARLEREKAVVLWEEAVGGNIARRAKAVSVRNEILFVVVQNSAWLQELSLLKEGIIEKVNSAVGTEIVKDIVFRIGDPGKENTDGG
jgi:predicted nucleic acid-binding Zn ribbon protein